MTQQNTLPQQTLTAFWLSLLSGLLMILSGRFMYNRLSRMPAGWGRHHMVWGRGMVGHLGLGWPWLGLVAGAIIVVSAIALYAYPRHRRSLGMTILVASLAGLFLGMGSPLAGVLGIVGGIVALIPKQPSPE